MKTNNDILAEYIRKKFPQIPLSIDFALYSLCERMKDFGKEAKEAVRKPFAESNEGQENELL